jgi:hypothetical protein
MVEIDQDGTIYTKGKRSVFVGSSPEALGVDLTDYVYPIAPFISDRRLK